MHCSGCWYWKLAEMMQRSFSSRTLRPHDRLHRNQERVSGARGGQDCRFSAILSHSGHCGGQIEIHRTLHTLIVRRYVSSTLYPHVMRLLTRPKLQKPRARGRCAKFARTRSSRRLFVSPSPVCFETPQSSTLLAKMVCSTCSSKPTMIGSRGHPLCSTLNSPTQLVNFVSRNDHLQQRIYKRNTTLLLSA